MNASAQIRRGPRLYEVGDFDFATGELALLNLATDCWLTVPIDEILTSEYELVLAAPVFP